VPTFISVRTGSAANAVEEWGQFMRAAEPSTDVREEQTAPDAAKSTKMGAQNGARFLRPRPVLLGAL
jgi:hypothetical protein